MSPPVSSLSARLTALERLVQVGMARSGPDGFSEKLLGDAEQLLAQAGQRLRMSSAHTVVTLVSGPTPAAILLPVPTGWPGRISRR